MTSLRMKLLAAATVIGLTGTGIAIHEGTDAYAAPGATLQMGDSSIPDVAERVVESVVNIQIFGKVRNNAYFYFNGELQDDDDDDNPYRPIGAGSGVIVSTGGRILTNAHVIQNADQIVVTLHDGTDVSAKVVGTDPKADLAVIQLEGKFPSLKPLKFGDSNALRLGETVLAVGNPLGRGKSVTMGIVSAKGRTGMGIETYGEFIQTDAAINQGNSGGALVNARGELVGINTAVAVNTQLKQQAAGISYAIPSHMAKPIMEELVAHGRVSRGYLGIGVQTINKELAKRARHLNITLGSERGAVITGVGRGTPAAKAGLNEADVITAINGTPIKEDHQVISMIGSLKPGTVVTLEVATPRNGTKTLKVKLTEQPVEDASRSLRRRSNRAGN